MTEVTSSRIFPSPSERWTGGQYSVARALLGLVLAGMFVVQAFHGAPVDAVGHPAGPVLDVLPGVLPGGVPNLFGLIDASIMAGVLASAGLLALLLAVGLLDRIAAVLLVWPWLSLFGSEPSLANPAAWFVALLLVAHVCQPSAPYGSVASRGRLDPRGEWRHRALPWVTLWCLMVLAYSYGGWLRMHDPAWVDGTALVRALESPLAREGVVQEKLLGLPGVDQVVTTWTVFGIQLLAVLIALYSYARAWLWGALLALQLAALIVLENTGTSLAMVLLHVFTFSPRWWSAKGGPGSSTVFFDGGCGLCHGFVRMLLAEDGAGRYFRFAPLQGSTFAVAVPEAKRGALPDTVVVRSPCGDLLLKSDAALHCLRRLGGGWRLLAATCRIFPRPLRDLVYDCIAAIRHTVFRKPTAMCPIMPPDLQQRFLP